MFALNGTFCSVLSQHATALVGFFLVLCLLSVFLFPSLDREFLMDRDWIFCFYIKGPWYHNSLSISMNLTILGTSCKWNHTIFVFL